MAMQRAEPSFRVTSDLGQVLSIPERMA